jgi:AcrR family transcriptional regulator
VGDNSCRGLRRDAARNRERVLYAARELFAARGLDANLNDVAKHANVGVGTVYRRFPTKEDLVEAIFEDGIDQVVCLTEEALRQQDSWAALVWYVEQLCELTATDRGLREVVFGTAYKDNVCIERARTRLKPLTTRLVERARADGHLRPDLAPSDMPIMGLLAGTVSEWAGHVKPDLWRRYVAIMLDGFRRRDGQQTLPVDALDDDQMHAAMRGWAPETG